MTAKFKECDVDHNGLVSLGEAKAVLMKDPFNFPEEKVGRHYQHIISVSNVRSESIENVKKQVFFLKKTNVYNV